MDNYQFERTELAIRPYEQKEILSSKNQTKKPKDKKGFNSMSHLFGVVCALLLVLPTITHANDNVPKPLQIEVFMSSEEHMGFGVSSTIIYGEKNAVLVDSQFTKSNAHRVVAELLELNRNLTHIYITHEHPDHWLGLSVVKQTFPNARAISNPVIAKAINGSLDFNIDYWGHKMLGRNGAKTKVEVEEYNESVIILEGREIEILGPFTSDAHASSSIWVPSIKTLIAGDTVFDHAHAWLADSKSPELRQEWLKTLDKLNALAPEVVVPGHAPSASYLSPSSINYTRHYIETFIAQMKETTNSTELISRMKSDYPDATCELCLYYSAKILKDGYIWDAQWPESLRNMEAK